MVSKKRKAETQARSGKRKKLGKPKPQERLELHSKQLKLNEQNLRPGAPDGKSATTKNEDQSMFNDGQAAPSVPEVATFRRLTLNDIFNRMSHYSGKEAAAGIDQLSEIIRRFPFEMKVHQFDISKRLIMCMTEHDDPYVRSSSIRALASLFTMMKKFSFSGGGVLIEHVIMKLFVSCVCSIMSDMFVRMRAFGMDITLLLIVYFPESMATHAYKLLPTLENVFLMTRSGHRHKGEDFKVIHDRAMNCLGHLTSILFQYGSKLQIDEGDIHTHCHKQMNLKQNLRTKQGGVSTLERDRAIIELEQSIATADFCDTSRVYQSINVSRRKTLNSFLEVMYKRESDINRVNAIDVTLSNLFTVDESIPESVLYSLATPYSLYRFCDRMFGTIKDKWVEAIQKGSNIQSVEQAVRIKTILRLMYGILYAIEHHNGVDFQKEIVCYLNDVLHHMVRCVPFTGTLEVGEKLNIQGKGKGNKLTKPKLFGTLSIDNIEELNVLIVSVLSFTCGLRLEKKKRLSKVDILVNWESLLLQQWEELVLSPETTHAQFGMLLGAFHRLQYQIPGRNRDKMWQTLTTVFLKEKHLSVRQRLLLHYLSDTSLDDSLSIPEDLLVQWIERIAKMLSSIPEKKIQMTSKLLLVVASFSKKPRFNDFLNTVIIESLPTFFYNNQSSTFARLPLDLQEKAVNLLHYFNSIPLQLVRALAKVCTTNSIPTRVITQIIEALRFKQHSIDLKAHITLLFAILTSSIKKSVNEREEIFHEILITISSFHKTEEMFSIILPIISSLLSKDEMEIETYYCILKVAFTVFDIAGEKYKSDMIWTERIPELVADIICNEGTSSYQVTNIYGLLEPNRDQFGYILQSFKERMDEDLVTDVFTGFSRLMTNFEKFKSHFVDFIEMATKICKLLKEKHDSRNAINEMESKLKLLV